MANEIQRPHFYEGQILGAADLQRSLDYAREQQARHARCSHTWGIASGLELSKRGQSAIQIGSGVAIDSSGAEIIVPASVSLDPNQFQNEIGGQIQDDYYPVFISRTNGPVNSSQLMGPCGTNGQTRIAESYAVRFRATAVDWDNQPDAEITVGPDDKDESDRVVLLGFAHWNAVDRTLDDFRLFDSKTQQKPRFIGIRADQVVATNGRLDLRSKKVNTAGAPAIVLDRDNEKQMFVLGVDKGDGQTKPLLSIDSKGNVTAQGTLQGQVPISVGQVQIQSGIATDGVTLPLPRTITQDQIDNDSVVIHTNVVARIDWSFQPDNSWAPFVLECFVDPTRRVKCQIRWMSATPNSFGTACFDVAGTVDYTVIAVVPPKESIQ